MATVVADVHEGAKARATDSMKRFGELEDAGKEKENLEWARFI